MLIARGHGEHVAIRMGESIVSPRHQTRAKFIAHIDTHISQGGLEGKEEGGEEGKEEGEEEGKEGEERRTKRGRNGGQRGGGMEGKEGVEWRELLCIIHSHCTNYSVHDMYRFHVTAVSITNPLLCSMNGNNL